MEELPRVKYAPCACACALSLGGIGSFRIALQLCFLQVVKNMVRQRTDNRVRQAMLDDEVVSNGRGIIAFAELNLVCGTATDVHCGDKQYLFAGARGGCAGCGSKQTQRLVSAQRVAATNC